MGLNYRLIQPPTVEPVSLSLAKQHIRQNNSDDDILIRTYISAAREYCEGFTNRAFYPQTYQYFLDSFPYGDYRSTVPLDQRSPWNYSAYWSDLAIRLPKPMLLNVNQISYIDGTGTQQTLQPTTDFYVDVNSKPARLTPLVSRTWPLTQFYQPGSICVEYVAASFAQQITENVSVSPNAAFTGQLAHQVINVVSVTDNSPEKNPLTYSLSPVIDANADPTSLTTITLSEAAPNNVAVVTYMAGMCPERIKLAMLLIIGHLYEHREENTEVSLKTLPLGVNAMLRKFVFSVMGNYHSGY